MIDLTGRAAVVTGAGKGIGRAHAMELAKRGAAVLVNDFVKDAATDTAQSIVDAGGRAAANFADIATEDGGNDVVAAALSQFGSIDIVVNNAGVLRPSYFEAMTISQIDAVLDSHLRSAFFVTLPAWKHMVSAGYGRIVYTGSSSAMFSNQGLANYAAAKSGLYGLTKALAFEGADHGIKVNLLLPFARTTISVDTPIPDMAVNLERYVTQEAQAKLVGRMEPEFVAAMCVYLASEKCAVSGEAFSVCGGRFGRVFVGVADGWLPSDVDQISAEAVSGHIDEIRDIARHSVPIWLFDELAGVTSRLQN